MIKRTKNKNRKILFIKNSKMVKKIRRPKRRKSIIKLNPKTISKKIKTKRVRFNLPKKSKDDYN